MNRFAKFSWALAALAACLAGCSSTVPAGMSEQDAKNAISRMTPEQKIRAIASSPLPQAEKERQYAEIEAKTGVKASEVLKNPPPAPSGR